MVYLSFFLDKKRNKKIKSWNFQRSITISYPKRKELATLKQLFFLRIFRLIDARFQIPMTEKFGLINFFGLQSQLSQVPLQLFILSSFKRFVVMLRKEFFNIREFVVDFVTNLTE
jgi:hypothetical protein